MVIISFREDCENKQVISDAGFFLKGTNDSLCFLIHGLTGTPKEMASLAKDLHKQGYSVYAPLMKSHDKSLSILKRTAWQDIYEAMKGEFLKYESNYRNILVGGLSFGALLGILLAYEFPEKIKALNCLSPTLFFDGWSTPKSKILLPFLYMTPLKYYIYFKEEYPYGIKNERLRSRIETYYKKASLFDYSQVHLYGYPVIPVSCMQQNELLAKYVMSILNKVRVPLQLLQALDDDITSPKNSQYIYDSIASEVKEIFFLKDSYHIITADQERDKVAEKTASFFARFN